MCNRGATGTCESLFEHYLNRQPGGNRHTETLRDCHLRLTEHRPRGTRQSSCKTLGGGPDAKSRIAAAENAIVAPEGGGANRASDHHDAPVPVPMPLPLPMLAKRSDDTRGKKCVIVHKMAGPPSYKLGGKTYNLAGILIDGGHFMWFNENGNRAILAKLCATLSTLGENSKKKSPLFTLNGRWYRFHVTKGPRRRAPPRRGAKTRKVQATDIQPNEDTLYDVQVRQVRDDDPKLWRKVTPVVLQRGESGSFATVRAVGPG